MSENEEKCWSCGGRGHFSTSAQQMPGHTTYGYGHHTCSQCKGTGKCVPIVDKVMIEDKKIELPVINSLKPMMTLKCASVEALVILNALIAQYDHDASVTSDEYWKRAKTAAKNLQETLSDGLP